MIIREAAKKMFFSGPKNKTSSKKKSEKNVASHLRKGGKALVNFFCGFPFQISTILSDLIFNARYRLLYQNRFNIL